MVIQIVPVVLYLTREYPPSDMNAPKIIWQDVSVTLLASVLRVVTFKRG